MTDKPSIIVDFSDRIERDLKQLEKKYRHVRSDMDALVEQLEHDERPGDRLQGLEYVAYKVRIRNSDIQKGKSGGYRVIYYIYLAELIALITIYSKAEREDVSIDEVRRFIEEYQPPAE